MFDNAHAFDSDISGWDVSSVTIMYVSCYSSQQYQTTNNFKWSLIRFMLYQYLHSFNILLLLVYVSVCIGVQYRYY